MELVENIVTNTPSQEITQPPQEAEDDSLGTVSLNTDKTNPQLAWYEDEVDLVVLRCRD
jgi:hypothetical protein